MTREIKFRAWNKQLKKLLFVSDIKGVVDLQKDSTEIYEIGCAERTNHGWKNGGSHEIDDMELMQYTGLTDKNGKEIYEGDIVASYYGAPVVSIITPVVFEKGCFIVKTPNHTPNQCNLNEFIDYMHEVEVIGNIYENPELI